MPHPAIWQYGLTVVWTAAVSAIALAGPWRRIRSARQAPSPR